MQFKSIILTLITLLVLNIKSKSNDLSSSALDSLFQEMSAFDKLSQLVLVKPESEENLPTEGGIYLDIPLTAMHSFDNQVIIVALDSRMNPFANSMLELPDLMVLAAITNSTTLEKYFNYFSSTCRRAGIDHIILPRAPAETRSASLLSKMHSFDSSFFVFPETFLFEIPSKKKAFIEAFDHARYVVVNSSANQNFNNQLSKYARKILQKVDCTERIKASLLLQSDNIGELTKMSNQLAVALSKGSVIPLQLKLGTLPLSSDSICLLTNQPYGSLANMLRKYAYVMTTERDIRISQAPIVIDNEAYFSEDLLSYERTIIFIGEISKMKPYTKSVDAALVYQKMSAIYNYTLPQQLFGATSSTGRLPDAYPEFSAFDDSPVNGNALIGFAPSFMVGLDQEALRKIEEIMQEAIQSGGTPGAQLAIAVDGSIVLDQAYGYLTYDSTIAVQTNTLYDLASLTKVTATLLAVMKLYEQGLIDLDAPISQWLPEYATSNKKDVTARALLSHNAGLRPYVPFWQRVLSADMLETFYYEDEEAEKADIRSYGTKPEPALQDTLKQWILNSPLLKYDSLPYYRYSDLGFMILHQIVESITKESLATYLSANFYQPMGLTKTMFNPLDRGTERFEIAPTEFDYYFRNELVWGQVHDRNAAIFGGVAGHAGLFSNARELTIILQTLLQGGTYAGNTFLEPSTINYFNQRFYPDNRRALGWDKADKTLNNSSQWSTDNSFGHTGFTGTMVWCDPEYDLVFVFLSNRIYPNSNNYELIKRDIRTRIQDVVYEALLAKWIK